MVGLRIDLTFIQSSFPALAPAISGLLAQYFIAAPGNGLQSIVVKRYSIFGSKFLRQGPYYHKYSRALNAPKVTKSILRSIMVLSGSAPSVTKEKLALVLSFFIYHEKFTCTYIDDSGSLEHHLLKNTSVPFQTLWRRIFQGFALQLRIRCVCCDSSQVG